MVIPREPDAIDKEAQALGNRVSIERWLRGPSRCMLVANSVKKTSKIANVRAAGKKTGGTKAPVAPKKKAKTVLVVDDEDHIGNMAKLFLELYGYQVLPANSGAAALALWAKRSSEIDLVITDLVMPSIDGATLIRALRKKRPDIPVILATGADAGDFTEELKGLKFVGQLQKPYTREKLLATVRKAVG
jgi:CheY-like chemotaxis protein